MAKKVYITALHMMHGGVEMSISLIANALVRKGYDVEILSTYNLGTPAYELNPEVKITYLTDLKPNRDEFKSAIKSKNVINIIKEGIYAARVLRAKKTSLIKAIKNISEGTILSTRNEHSVILSQYGNCNVKKIAQLHHDHKFDEKLIKDFQNNYSNIDYFALLTELLTEEVMEMMKDHNSKTKCICIPNFLENEPIDKSISKEKQVIAVGRLHSVKGFDRLIDIWDLVVKECPEWKLKIVGGGDEEVALKEKINKLSLEKNVILTGAMNHEETMKEMCKSSIFAMTSHSEGFPFVLIESLMCKTPVVAFDVRVGPRAIIEDGKEGYLIADNELKEFSNQLIELMKNERLRKELSDAAEEKSKEFIEEKIIEKWLEIL
ncbi:MAG: glycosyltransferase [Clostridium sp.]|nr:glycosyltransferase [Clostridium sp.]MDU7083463.1 glycosyltransferase [Clostridium sp.]